MTDTPRPIDVSRDGHVAIVELRRPPHNFFDREMVVALADAFEALDADAGCRSIVLCAQGSSFCAGADFSPAGDRRTVQVGPDGVNPLYREALRMFACGKPVVAAVHGAAVGGGLGLALVADFRVSCAEARFSANFARLGFHPGFGLTVTLPRLVGTQHAATLFYTGRRVGGELALGIGLVDRLVPRGDVRAEAIALAREIAVSSPLVVQSVRRSLRAGLLERLRDAIVHESAEQSRHFATEDAKEGVRAMAERREPRFEGR